MSNQQLVKQTEDKGISFIPFGSQESIKLSVAIIKNMVCTPTKSGKVCDDRQAIKFMMLCQAQHLNPFAGDCFLIGYDGRNGPEFSMITAHQAFLKRAEVSKDFDGMESGVIVRNKESGVLRELEGDFFEDQFDDLVGAWARVHHKSHKIPTTRRGALKTYRKDYGLWANSANHAMMLVKCVEADALRATFPTMLGGLYTPGEVTEIEAEPVTQRTARLVATVADAPTASAETEQPAAAAAAAIEAKPEPQSNGTWDWVTQPGYTFDEFVRVVNQEYPKTHGPTITEKWTSFDDIGAADSRLFNRARAGILAELEKAKGAA